ncbi:CoA transferase subunit A [Cohnella abietis]|uniref:CoA transferase subunit A n=1 Tax=Cohnella abietis TaxID=2507935 RepID=A0A3T1CZ54_9BACL|nr:CoA-transferase [Cohnella abietis]BBI31132.1 CoA transferase subunit A [Cohnella abietis]
MTDKFTTLQQAVEWVSDGMVVAISGNMDMSPMSFIRELIKAGKKNIQLICIGSSGINADILLGSDSLRSVEFSQISLGEFGFAPHFRRRLEEGSIETKEHACPALFSAIQAGAMGIPFIPVRGLLETDYMNIRTDFIRINNPYNVEQSVAIVPSIRPDLAIFHAFKADRKGNVVAHSLQNNRILAQAAVKTIVTVEEIVTEQELASSQGSRIPSTYISAIVHAPHGAHPTTCPGYYPADADHIRGYVKAASSPTDFQHYLDSYETPTTGRTDTVPAHSIETKEVGV